MAIARVRTRDVLGTEPGADMMPLTGLHRLARSDKSHCMNVAYCDIDAARRQPTLGETRGWRAPSPRLRAQGCQPGTDVRSISLVQASLGSPLARRKPSEHRKSSKPGTPAAA